MMSTCRPCLHERAPVPAVMTAIDMHSEQGERDARGVRGRLEGWFEGRQACMQAVACEHLR